MRFSLRSLLSIMLLAAIVFPLVIGFRKLGESERFAQQLYREIQREREKLALDRPEIQKVRARSRDEFASLAQAKTRALEAFDQSQRKYSAMEPRGSDVLSLRAIPQVSLDDRSPPVVFRLIVPFERPVWLKYGLVPGDGGSQLSPLLDRIKSAPKDSSFSRSGPYEMKLEPGERTLSVELGRVNGDRLPILVRLDNELLLDTLFEADRTPSAGTTHISARRQIDYAPSRRLPWLLNVRIRLENEGGTRENAPFICGLWLSDKESGTQNFPKRETTP